jgi:hypothetical protein
LTGTLWSSASVASTLAVAFGEAYITALYVLTKEDVNRIPTAEEIRDEFMRQLKSLKKEPVAGITTA